MSRYQDERIKQQEEILLKRKRDIENKLKIKDETKTIKLEEGENNSNKFTNDGSFLEQFKKGVSSSGISSPLCGKSTFMKKNSIVENPEDETEQIKMEPCGMNQSSANREDDPSKSDWFQDALKRAKEKAKALVPDQQSACLSQGPAEEIKKRKSRWAEETPQTNIPLPSVVIPGLAQQTNFSMPGQVMNMVGVGQHMEAIQGIMITKLTRDNPAIIAYAMKVFGTLDLTDAQWKQCEEQMKMNIVFQLLQAKKKEAERLEQQGKVKYEYDSDEEIEGGTWEHKRRKQEMEETAKKAETLTNQAEGKHHIGDFLPPEELSSFMEKYQALKDGRDPDMSDYRENRLTEDNIGYKMLKSMGWTEGMGLGAEGKGITTPIAPKPKGENQGLGIASAHNLSVDDDEYDAYRKRMMLAYRFRPNPLNNPRRAYY